jgi:magnesium transporter
VVDDGDRLVGVLTFDDIVDVIEEEAEEDIRRRRRGGKSSDSVGYDQADWLFANC